MKKGRRRLFPPFLSFFFSPSSLSQARLFYISFFPFFYLGDVVDVEKSVSDRYSALPLPPFPSFPFLSPLILYSSLFFFPLVPELRVRRMKKG